MKWINEPIPQTGYSEEFLGLTTCELTSLLPVFERSLKEYKMKFERYEDIHQSGEMPEFMAARMFDCGEIVENLKCLISLIEERKIKQ